MLPCDLNGQKRTHSQGTHNTHKHRGKQHKMTELLFPPTPTLSCSTLPLLLSLAPSFTHLHSSSWCLRTSDTKTLPCLTVFLRLSCPLWSCHLFSSSSTSVWKSSTCESGHCWGDNWIQVCLWVLLFSLFVSSLKSTLIYFSLDCAVWKVTVCKPMNAGK